MTSYKMLLDPSVYLSPCDFPKPREVTIARMAREDLPARKGEAKTAAPMLYVVGRDGKEYEKPMKVPKSIMYGLSLMFGTDYEGWTGKKITIFAAWCLAFGDVEECLRVKFPDQIDSQVRRWLKKRKAPVGAYMTDPPERSTPAPVATTTDQESARAVEREAAQDRGEA